MASEATRADTPTAVVLVKQPHGGALIPGGPKDRKNVGGRPASWIRAEMRKGLQHVVKVVNKAVREGKHPHTGKPLTLEDYERAGNFLARFGVGVPMEVGVPDGAPFTVAVIAAPLPE